MEIRRPLHGEPTVPFRVLVSRGCHTSDERKFEVVKSDI